MANTVDDCTFIAQADGSRTCERCGRPTAARGKLRRPCHNPLKPGLGDRVGLVIYAFTGNSGRGCGTCGGIKKALNKLGSPVFGPGFPQAPPTPPEAPQP